MLRIQVKPVTREYEILVETEADEEAAIRFLNKHLALSPATPPSPTATLESNGPMGKANGPPPLKGGGPERVYGSSVLKDGKFASPSGLSQSDRLEITLERIGPASSSDIALNTEFKAELTSNTSRDVVNVVRQVVSRSQKFVRLKDGRYALVRWIGDTISPTEVAETETWVWKRLKMRPPIEDIQLKYG